jgi:hypothetical protein
MMYFVPERVLKNINREQQREHANNHRRNSTMIKTLRTKPLRMLAIAVLPLALLGTACSSDDDGDSPADTEATSDAPADTEADGEEPTGTEASGEETGEGSADVEAFCTQVDEFVVAMEEVLADPASGDVAAITAQGQELATSAAALAGSIDAADSARLQECTEQLSTIGS